MIGCDHPAILTGGKGRGDLGLTWLHYETSIVKRGGKVGSEEKRAWKQGGAVAKNKGR